MVRPASGEDASTGGGGAGVGSCGGAGAGGGGGEASDPGSQRDSLYHTFAPHFS